MVAYPLIDFVMITFKTPSVLTQVLAANDELKIYWRPSIRQDEDDDTKMIFNVGYRMEHVNLSKAFNQDLSGMPEEDQIMAIDDFKSDEEKRISQILVKALQEKFKQGFSQVYADISITFEQPTSLDSLVDCKIDYEFTLHIKIPIEQLEETLKHEIMLNFSHYGE